MNHLLKKNRRTARGATALTMTIAALIATFTPLAVLGQADVGEHITVLTQQMAKQPRQADLYLSRGDLYRAQQNWDAAQADFDQASGLNPTLEATDLFRGRMFLEANWPLSAKVALDRFLTKQSNHVEALTIRARAEAKLGNRIAAARDYTRAIQFTPEALPDLYVERAQTMAADGEPSIEKALQGLDEGIQKLGPLVPLQLGAIDLELKLKQYDRALSRLETLAATSPRKEAWLARKGEIFHQAGRSEQARAAFQAALEAMETLPPGRRYVPAMLELQKRIREQLASLK